MTTAYAFGQHGTVTHNPVDKGYTPGGSSSGSAAAHGAFRQQVHESHREQPAPVGVEMRRGAIVDAVFGGRMKCGIERLMARKVSRISGRMAP